MSAWLTMVLAAPAIPLVRAWSDTTVSPGAETLVAPVDVSEIRWFPEARSSG